MDDKYIYEFFKELDMDNEELNILSYLLRGKTSDEIIKIIIEGESQQNHD